MRTGPMLTLLALLPLFIGCATLPRYTELSRDFRVEAIFTQGQVLPRYRYFYTGPDHEPDALLALDRDWTLDGLYWTEIDLTEAQLKNWLRQFRIANGHYDDWVHGIIIYSGMVVPDRSRNPIGAMYVRYGQVYVRYGEGDEKRLTIVGPERPAGAAFRD
jgi:hypothetical protein